MKIPVGFGFLSAELRFVEVNQALADMLGYTRDELIGRSIADVTHPDDLGRTDAFWEHARTDRSIKQRSETRYRRKDGGIVSRRVTALAFHDEPTGSAYAVTIIDKATESPSVQAALQRAREAEASRRRDVARLEGILLVVRETSHQLSNALSRAQGYTELTLLRNDLSAPSRHMLDLSMQGLSSVTTSLHLLQRAVRAATASTSGTQTGEAESSSETSVESRAGRG